MTTQTPAVLLGDACCGKTQLLRVACGGTYESVCPASVSAASWALPNAVTVWDMPGTERFMTAKGTSRIQGFPLCILAYDISCRASFEALDAWLDEYLQFGFDGGAKPPVVVLVGCKADCEDDDEAVPISDVNRWCAAHPFGPSSSRWIFQCRTSAKKGEVTDFFHAVSMALATVHTPPPLPPRYPCWTSGAEPANLDAAPTLLLRAAVAVEHASVAPGSTKFVQDTAATLELCRGTIDSPPPPVGADVAVLVMRLRFAAVAVSQIVAWSDEMKDRSLYRLPNESLSLIIVGIPSTDFTEDTRAAARRAAVESGAAFLSYESVAQEAAWWHDVVQQLFKSREGLLVERSSRSSKCTADVLASSSPSPIAATPVEISPNAMGEDSSTMARRASSSVAGLPADAALLAMHRQILEASMDGQRRESALRDEIAAERRARHDETRALQAEVLRLQEEVREARLEAKVMWDELDAVKRHLGIRR
jgi:hypothetical protein